MGRGLLVVIQARMGSSRLPGKVLADLAGRPMLRFQIERLADLYCDHLVVATSELPADDAIVDAVADTRAEVVRGPELDVLARFGLAVEQFDPETVVRLTADCPLTDPQIVADVVALHRSTGADYTSNVWPRSFPKGLDVEAVAAGAIEIAVAEAVDPYDREHVTPFLYRHPDRFVIANLDSGRDLGELWWTVDTPEDLASVRDVVGTVDDPVHASWAEILAAVTEAGRLS